MNAFTQNTLIAEENTRIFDDFMCNMVCTSWEERIVLDAQEEAERIEREQAKIKQAEESRQTQELLERLRKEIEETTDEAELAALWSFYSDVFKDEYGTRPRHGCWW